MKSTIEIEYFDPFNTYCFLFNEKCNNPAFKAFI